jgi:hypothetical protein
MRYVSASWGTPRRVTGRSMLTVIGAAGQADREAML